MKCLNPNVIAPPILIAGIPRSGTSMTAGIIHHCGAWGGKMVGPTRYNKKGMFENNEIRNDVLKPFLRRIKADPMGQTPLPDISIVNCIAENGSFAFTWRQKIEAIIKDQGYVIGNTWFYKEPKILIVWPMFEKAFPGAFWVIVRRDDKDIINSCLKTGFMRAYRDANGWQGWIDEYKKRIDEIKASSVEYRELWPQEIIDGDLQRAIDLIDWLGLNWNPKVIKDFIAPELWKQGSY